MRATRVLWKAVPRAGGMPADPWVTLGVTRSATTKEIKKAYLKKARKVHPDITGDASTAEEFVRLREAYQVLMTRRKAPPPPGARNAYAEAKAQVKREEEEKRARAPSVEEIFWRKVRAMQDDVRSMPGLLRRWVAWETSCARTALEHMIFWPTVGLLMYGFFLVTDVGAQAVAIDITPHREKFHKYINEEVDPRTQAMIDRDHDIQRRMYEDLAERDEEDEALLREALAAVRGREESVVPRARDTPPLDDEAAARERRRREAIAASELEAAGY